MRWNRSNSRGISAAGTPIPVSETVTTASASSRRDPHGDGAVEGELQRVGQQVEDHLLPHVAVEVDGFVQRRTVHDEVQARPVDGRAEHAGQLGGDGRQVDGLVARLHAARLDAGEVEQRVDQLGQPQPVAVDHLQLLSHRLVHPVGPAAQFGERPEDQRERGAELVADVGEERGLGAVQLGQFLGAPLLGPVAAGAADLRRDVRGDQLRRSRGSRRRGGGSGSGRRPGTRSGAAPCCSSGTTSARVGGSGQSPVGSPVKAPPSRSTSTDSPRAGLVDRPHRGFGGQHRGRHAGARRRCRSPPPAARGRRRRTGRSG